MNVHVILWINKLLRCSVYIYMNVSNCQFACVQGVSFKIPNVDRSPMDLHTIFKVYTIYIHVVLKAGHPSVFFPVLIMCVMYIVCLGYLSFLPTSALASVLCTCISMYVCKLHVRCI